MNLYLASLCGAVHVTSFPLSVSRDMWFRDTDGRGPCHSRPLALWFLASEEKDVKGNRMTEKRDEATGSPLRS